MGVVQGLPTLSIGDGCSCGGGSLMPPGSVYAFLAEHRRELFSDAMFAGLVPWPMGRPSVPADVVVAALLQHADGKARERDDPPTRRPTCALPSRPLASGGLRATSSVRPWRPLWIRLAFRHGQQQTSLVTPTRR